MWFQLKSCKTPEKCCQFSTIKRYLKIYMEGYKDIYLLEKSCIQRQNRDAVAIIETANRVVTLWKNRIRKKLATYFSSLGK